VSETNGFEGWAILDGYPSYEVSTHGRVRRSARILRQHAINGGYLVVQLWKDNKPKTALNIGWSLALS
jgi:hypothetical protein